MTKRQNETGSHFLDHSVVTAPTDSQTDTTENITNATHASGKTLPHFRKVAVFVWTLS